MKPVLNHSKPNLQAAVAVWYASVLAGEPIDLNQAEEAFREMGVHIDVLRQYINIHNNEISQSKADPKVVEALVAKPRLSDPGYRRKVAEKLPNLPDVHCSCGHSWKSRSRFGRSVVRCHRCGRHVEVQGIREASTC